MKKVRQNLCIVPGNLNIYLNFGAGVSTYSFYHEKYMATGLKKV